MALLNSLYINSADLIWFGTRTPLFSVYFNHIAKNNSSCFYHEIKNVNEMTNNKLISRCAETEFGAGVIWQLQHNFVSFFLILCNRFHVPASKPFQYLHLHRTWNSLHKSLENFTFGFLRHYGEVIESWKSKMFIIFRFICWNNDIILRLWIISLLTCREW